MPFRINPLNLRVTVSAEAELMNAELCALGAPLITSKEAHREQ